MITKSRPMRARGLKRKNWEVIDMDPTSRPMRARGLKLHVAGYYLSSVGVAPHAGAWIETPVIWWVNAINLRRAPCGRVD